MGRIDPRGYTDPPGCTDPPDCTGRTDPPGYTDPPGCTDPPGRTDPAVYIYLQKVSASIEKGKLGMIIDRPDPQKHVFHPILTPSDTFCKYAYNRRGWGQNRPKIY